MKPKTQKVIFSKLFYIFLGSVLGINSALATINLPDKPIFTSGLTEPPLVLLTMARDHKLFYEAYNDASDLNADGQFDVGYKPDEIDYFGYFDSFKCYVYNTSPSLDRFEPTATTSNKKCSGALEWSGDFLNYLTTARMDAIRKVLYGGYRAVDSTSETVLERTHVPQDAHSWGKEYESVAVSGYDITEYSPLVMPNPGTRHLFANTSVNTSDLVTVYEPPLLRTLTHTNYRVWEWLSIERVVADTKCGNPVKSNCVPSSSSSVSFNPIPANATNGFSNLTREIYDTTQCNSAAPNNTCAGINFNISNKGDFDTFENAIKNGFATLPPAPGITPFTDSVSQINQSSTNGPIPSSGGFTEDFYTEITGDLNIGVAGIHEFAIDGDDAVEFAIDINNDGDFDDAGEIVANYYGLHGFCFNCGANQKRTANLAAGTYNIRMRHNELGGGAGYIVYWKQPPAPTTTLSDLEVRVQVCASGLLETNCKIYSDGTNTYHKPTGILHDFGEDDTMKFGLLTGSYQKNLSGGVLRKKMGTFTDEVNANTGQFTSVNGIVKTINGLREIGFKTNEVHGNSCGFIFKRPFNEGECRWWGNPVAEMMYEGMRYLSGKAAPTPDFSISATGNDDADLGLPLVTTWDDPYNTSNQCAIPMQMVISDINPNYDTDKVPGTSFGSFSGDVTGLNVSTIADSIITPLEPDVPGSHFIGEVGATADGAPTPKTVTGLGNIRGLAPEEPTKQGGYYSASIGYHGITNDIHAAAGEQNINTLAVAIASPLPQFEIPVGSNTVTMVPFAKTVGGCGGVSASGSFQPTNTIVDFYIENIFNTNANNQDATVNNGLPSYKFRINFEDAEQGADHDMDAIAEYTVEVKDNVLLGDPSDDTLSIDMNSNYAAGGCIQHMGYIISGTTADGTYLEVRDQDTGAGSDPDFFLDTPPGVNAGDPGNPWNDGVELPLDPAARIFTPGTAGGATLLKDPLWYAAKWGGFIDDNNNNLPDQSSEWDADSDGVPDNYFLVTNAGNLAAQLQKAFIRITQLTGVSASSVAINSTVLRTNTRLYQARFNTSDWAGEVSAFVVKPDGTVDTTTPVWNASENIPAHGARSIFSMISKDHDANAATPDQLTPVSFVSTEANLVTAVGSASILNYVRGDTANEVQNGGVFRDRPLLANGDPLVLGDVVNGAPISVGITNFGYSILGSSEASSYPAFLSAKNTLYTDSSGNEFTIVYAASNDGMLHAFIDSTDTNPSTAGDEIFAYVPRTIHSRLNLLTAQNYGHEFFVDATPHSSDAYVDPTGSGSPSWKTLLTGTLGVGGRGLYMLDVSDPLNFGTSHVLWEVNSTDSTTLDNVLGFIPHSPFIAKLKSGKWVVIVGNGYNSATHKARLLIFDAETGALIRDIDTGVGNGGASNGLAQPFLLDENSDRITDFVYAGDLYGNLWKFDLTDANPANWKIANDSNGDGTGTPVPLYTALDSSGNPQPITTRPILVNNSASSAPTPPGYVVLFGTGKYFETGDNIIPNNPPAQTFYGIHDDLTQNTVGSGRGNLVQQNITAEIDVFDTNGNFANTARLTSDNPVNYTTEDGWYIELISPVNGNESERVIANPLIRFGRVIFTTFIPAGACEDGGKSTIMELDAVNGARLDNSVFDYNNDGVIDAADLVLSGGSTQIGSGIYIPPTLGSPVIVSAGDVEYKQTSGTAGGITTTTEAGASTVGRQSWRQIK